MAQLRYNFDIHVAGLRERANAYKYFMPRRSCDQASLEHKSSALPLRCCVRVLLLINAEHNCCIAVLPREGAEHMYMCRESYCTCSLPRCKTIILSQTDARTEPSVNILPSC